MLGMSQAGNESGNGQRDEVVPEAASADEARIEVEVVEPGEAEGLSFVEVDDDDIEVVEDVLEESQAQGQVEAELRARIAELEAENKAQYERMLRVAADAENLKRRTEREKEEIRRYGTEKVMTDLIPVLDNLERALTHGRTSQDRESLLQGVEMVQRQFEQALGRYGCKSFDSLGTQFDPLRHEAVQQVESPEHPSNTVVEEYQRGYFLQDRLIRPALVVVSRLPAGMDAPRASAATEDEVPIAVDVDGEAFPADGEGQEPSPPVDGESTEE